ncbi:OmpA family protein [Mesorhizobium sp. YR577]|uniref:OmpA family protein n=1 Tax=Mesorhizobium sp. YR577 TaxID=1884373 RepID=UPI0008ECFF9C|nr:OmpA family protein [Mesorhizobium sp. YR577]SFU23031.1 OmpA family protein [Mesorhizobium sp. YR577]
MRTQLIGVLWTAALTVAAHAQDIDPVATLGVPDMGSARALAIDGKVLDISGIGSATTVGALALKDAADVLARQNTTLTVRADGRDLRVAMQGDILFAFDRFDVQPAAEPTLTALAQMIAASKAEAIVVEGHTDAKGSDTYNQALSQQRAAAVIDWLVAKAEQPRERFTARGLGEKEPVAPNLKADGSDDPEGRQMNRRVEFVFPNTRSLGGG